MLTPDLLGFWRYGTVDSGHTKIRSNVHHSIPSSVSPLFSHYSRSLISVIPSDVGEYLRDEESLI